MDLLRDRARDQPDRTAYVFLADGERRYAELTYASLGWEARRWAACFARVSKPGDRILLLLPPGIELIAAFFGALCGGFVAVPTHPPHRERSALDFRAFLDDVRPSVVVAASPEVVSKISQGRDDSRFVVLTPDLVDAEPNDASTVDAVASPGIDPDTTAVLQYTSGATAQPRGVVLTHGNLIHNLRLIAERFEHSSDSRGVIWLPPHHDMGLIGGILQPLYVGFPVVLMSPMHVLQRPLRWLQAISDWRATTSGGPDFCFDMCVERIGEQERAGLDLSSWDVAFTGAEPVRLRTLERFAQAFAPCGFKPEAWFPCYGLAEATLMVSGGPKSRSPRVLRVAADELLSNRVVPDPGGRPVVSCGEVSEDQEIVVVDPQTRRERRPAQVGEFWIAGASVASGYWDRPKQSEDTFAARLARATPPTAGDGSQLAETARHPESSDTAFLRTGDLGFVWEGELYVTGRCKDLIIVAGRNHYPQDIERTIEDVDEAIQASGCAAFCSERADSEVLIAIAEIRRRARARLTQAEGGRELLRAVRRAVAREHDLHIADLVLVLPASLPRTSSGKLRRGECRLQYQRGTLRTI